MNKWYVVKSLDQFMKKAPKEGTVVIISSSQKGNAYISLQCRQPLTGKVTVFEEKMDSAHKKTVLNCVKQIGEKLVKSGFEWELHVLEMEHTV